MSAWHLETHDRVAVLTFTRPPRNWMNTASMTELERQRFQQLNTSDEAKARNAAAPLPD